MQGIVMEDSMASPVAGVDDSSDVADAARGDAGCA